MIQLIENYQAIIRKLVFLLLIFIVNFSFSQGLKTSGKKIVDKNGMKYCLEEWGLEDG
jgi:ABC-type arginine transport system permease subunit